MEEALLRESDVPGWTAQLVEDPASGGDECSVHGADVAPEALAGVEFSKADPSGGDLYGAFQDVLAFADSTTAEQLMSTFGQTFVDCVTSTPPSEGQLTVDDAVPLDVADAGLAEVGMGWTLQFAPDPAFGELLTSMDIVFVRRGRFVSSVAAFRPLADDVDVVQLASAAYQRLPD